MNLKIQALLDLLGVALNPVAQHLRCWRVGQRANASWGLGFKSLELRAYGSWRVWGGPVGKFKIGPALNPLKPQTKPKP